MAGVAPEQTNDPLAAAVGDLERRVRRQLARLDDLERRLAEARHDLLGGVGAAPPPPDESRELAQRREVA